MKATTYNRLIVFFICGLAGLLLFSPVLAADDPAPALMPWATVPPPGLEGDPYEMNGIRMKDYPDFQKKWQLVTVRFRTDTGEQRFTYANDIAYKTLMKQSKDYPDGAVFAKIGIMTKEDPEFISSKVPAGAARVQFMVRNHQTYTTTGGWGYALFSPAGFRTDPSPPEKQAEACDVCHQVVKETRGEVFSQPANLLAFPGPPAPNEIPKIAEIVFSHEQASFHDHAVGKLPKQIQEILPPAVDSVRFAEGTLRDHAFSGTLNEIQPFLIKEAARSGHPALFLDRDEKKFTLVFSVPHDPKFSCPGKATPFRIYLSSVLDPNNPIPAAIASSTCVEP